MCALCVAHPFFDASQDPAPDPEPNKTPPNKPGQHLLRHALTHEAMAAAVECLGADTKAAGHAIFQLRCDACLRAAQP